MRIGSLFSGAGGLDLAVERVFGGETVWHCELDPAASKVLAHRWPRVPNLGDITKVDWATVEPVDILCGGWPCQPFSLAGKKKGAEDERALWPYVAGAVRVVRPRIICLENVSAVLGPEFQRVANDLAEIGYDIAWTCLRASDVGAPHRRERVFIVAYAGSEGCQRGCQRALPTPNAQDGNGGGRFNSEGHQSTLPGTVRELLPTPRSSDCFGAGLHGDGGMDLRTTVTLLQTPSTADGDGGHLNRSGSRKGELLPGQAREMATSWGKYAPAITRWEQVTRPAPSPTEPNTKGNLRLSAAFSEWLMGWPAGWVTGVPGISRNDALRIIGNGVCPQQATAGLRWLLSVRFSEAS